MWYCTFLDQIGCFFYTSLQVGFLSAVFLWKSFLVNTATTNLICSKWEIEIKGKILLTKRNFRTTNDSVKERLQQILRQNRERNNEIFSSKLFESVWNRAIQCQKRNVSSVSSSQLFERLHPSLAPFEQFTHDEYFILSSVVFSSCQMALFYMFSSLPFEFFLPWHHKDRIQFLQRVVLLAFSTIRDKQAEMYIHARFACTSF